MPNITIQDAQAWAEKSKLNVTTLDLTLEAAQAQMVLNRLSTAYDISAWSTPEGTPALVRKAIAMLYMGWYYLRTFSEEDLISNYGERLIADATVLVESISSGLIALSDVSTPNKNLAIGTVSFEPAELDEGPYFTMSRTW